MAAARRLACWRRCWPLRLNANLGGRDHIPIEVERQIARWMQRLFGFPESATGLFVTGTSIANLIGVLIARDAALGFETRCAGVVATPKKLTAYASSAAHTCVARAHGFRRARQRCAPADLRGSGLSASNLAELQKRDRRRPPRGLHAVPGGGYGRHGRYRRD